MKSKTYDFEGYTAFFDTGIMNRISDSLDRYGDGTMYMTSIVEAVSNASKFSVQGEEKAHIRLSIKTTADDIITTVSSETRSFDVAAFHRSLKQLAEDHETGAKEWGEYLGLKETSRGFWYMLTGVEYLFVDTETSEVTLVARIPFPPAEEHSLKIRDLVSRFYTKKGGIIYD